MKKKEYLLWKYYFCMDNANKTKVRMKIFSKALIYKNRHITGVQEGNNIFFWLIGTYII